MTPRAVSLFHFDLLEDEPIALLDPSMREGDALPVEIAANDVVPPAARLFDLPIGVICSACSHAWECSVSAPLVSSWPVLAPETAGTASQLAGVIAMSASGIRAPRSGGTSFKKGGHPMVRLVGARSRRMCDIRVTSVGVGRCRSRRIGGSRSAVCSRCRRCAGGICPTSSTCSSTPCARCRSCAEGGSQTEPVRHAGASA